MVMIMARSAGLRLRSWTEVWTVETIGVNVLPVTDREKYWQKRSALPFGDYEPIVASRKSGWWSPVPDPTTWQSCLTDTFLFNERWWHNLISQNLELQLSLYSTNVIDQLIWWAKYESAGVCIRYALRWYIRSTYAFCALKPLPAARRASWAVQRNHPFACESKSTSKPSDGSARQ